MLDDFAQAKGLNLIKLEFLVRHRDAEILGELICLMLIARYEGQGVIHGVEKFA
jgi:hypothetical protein